MATDATSPFPVQSKDKNLWFQRGLMATFISSITLWYFSTPYLVGPHPKFRQEMDQLVSNLSNPSLDQIENWTKWRLYIGEGEDRQVVHAMDQVALSSLVFPLKVQLEWRPAYSVDISRDWWTGDVRVEERHPWYSGYGIYSHYRTQVVGGTIRFLPNFMFGLPMEWVERLYPGGADEVPISGMMAESVDRDRVIVQCFMNLVILAVILMLFMNHPPKQTKVD